MPAFRFLPLLPVLSLLTPGAAMTATSRYYDVTYRAHFHPETGVVDMEIALSGERLPSRIVLSVDPQRHKKFTSTDPLQKEPARVTWQPQGHMLSELRRRHTSRGS